MRRLTEQEIKFLKETGWTPTMYQMNNDREYSRAEYKKSQSNDLTWNDYYTKLANDLFNVDLDELYNKCTEEYDSISLENEAPYVMSVLLSIEELDELACDGAKALEWLQNWQYFCGYRKYEEDEAMMFARAAINIKLGVFFAREYSDTDESIWIYDSEGNLV